LLKHPGPAIPALFSCAAPPHRARTGRDPQKDHIAGCIAGAATMQPLIALPRPLSALPKRRPLM